MKPSGIDDEDPDGSTAKDNNLTGWETNEDSPTVTRDRLDGPDKVVDNP